MSNFDQAETKTLRNFKAVIDSFGAKNTRIERQEVQVLMWIALTPTGVAFLRHAAETLTRG